VMFSAKQQRTIKRWISCAAPMKGLFFRSVEYRYMDPIDGAGARAYGGRFAPIGTRRTPGRAKRSQHANRDSVGWGRSASTSILVWCLRSL
jgi:hypothetical protein